MKKGQTYTGKVVRVNFPNKGIVKVDPYLDGSGNTVNEQGSETCVVKNVVSGQRVSFVVNKKKGGRCEGRLEEVIERSSDEITPSCKHFGICGGCTYLNLPYEKQLELKERQVRSLLSPVIPDLEDIFEGIKASPVQFGYRNKMEFSFGDSCKDGDLELGLHKRGSFYDILSVKDCKIVDEDYRLILKETLAYFRGKDTPYYHKLRHTGYLRHLLIRKAVKTGEILVDLVTTTQEPAPTICTEVSLIDDWKDVMLTIESEGKLKGHFAGILHTFNDSMSDTIVNDKTDILYGQDFFYEELLSLKFKISPFSFFQTNSLSAEVLYDTAREYILSCLRGKVVYDLYSGTGTIAQLLAPVADKVIGVEIVEEAVIAARENAELNGLHNCEFIAGDVLKVLDGIQDKPDLIVLDPPRDGVNPKALKKIINYGVDNILYISCKPTSLARDLEMLTACGYKPVRICALDQFPGTVHVETVVLLSKGEIPSKKVKVEFSLEGMDTDGFKDGATYDEIRDWVQEKYDLHVTNLNIAQVKRKNGIIERENYNKPKSEDSRQPGTTPEKEKAITEALKHFNMI
ncbi:MAG: 23S rRNA (uracil(1939)-C(5))-methyltransferase RlmD [Lachnospiraceae bacterium]|nr:23S rRNA (uracil(1939)-C(5))-methyltransferase RlmD [Lachnospiraceae bacterium]